MQHADTTVTATGPTEPLATPISTGATVALEAQIAGLREVGAATRVRPAALSGAFLIIVA